MPLVYSSSSFLSGGTFMLLFIFVFAFALWAQFRVSRAYSRNARIPSRGGLTGQEAAAAIMAQAGITDVTIEETGGHLTDHYDPLRKCLVLSSEDYHGTSLAAVGVAAHESGHAIQHHAGYQLLYARMALVPATRFVSGIVPILILASWFLTRGLTGLVLDVAIVCYAILTLFQLVTLPVEFDASRRAKAQLVSLGILERDEMPGVNQTLDAAALTYVAAFVSTLLVLLQLLFFLGSPPVNGAKPGPRPFLSPLVILAIGVAIGFFCDRMLRPSPPAPEPAPVAADAPPPAVAVARAGLDCEVSSTFHDNIYPSLVLSMGSSYPEYARCLSLAVVHAPVGRPCRIRIESTLFQQPLAYATTPLADRWSVTPDLPWNYAALRHWSQVQPELFVVSITAGGRTVQRTFTATVHAVNEAVSRVYDPDAAAWQDTSVCFAAFVNEDHPLINPLLQEATARGPVTHFTGYQLGPASVLPQMQAIWEALAARGLNYVDLGTTSGGVAEVETQYVRFLDQALRDQGANCVDASALFASVFRRIGLRPVLVFRPGHCFVAVYDAQAGGQLVGLETTLLGSAPFATALAYGAQELQAAAPNFGTAGYSSVDLVAARDQGVKPIAYEEVN